MQTPLSIVLLGEGLITGLMLTLMIGPVTMIILRYGLQVNRVAGVYAASGTWVSDFIFIGLTYWMTTSIEQWSQRPDIKLILFLSGGAGLLLMGAWMMNVRRKVTQSDVVPGTSSYWQAFAGGFLVNTLSPFTLFFWLGAAVFLHLQTGSPIWYYGGLMLTLGAGDVTKAWLAPRLTQWLKENHLYWVQMAAGLVIAGTGIYILFLGIFEA